MKIKAPSILDYRGMQAVKRAVAYLGPGFFVTVGFIDPGNWATNLAAGSEFNYQLLWVVLLSSLILVLWQHMSAHLGIITGKCLAEAVHSYTKPKLAFVYGVTAMTAMIATALAEILGAGIGINILFGIPVKLGAFIAACVIIIVLLYQKYGLIEKIIVGFVSVIGFCYLFELYIVKPNWGLAAVSTFIPNLDSKSLLVAIGIIGAVVMPHNIYLHSEVIQSRNWSGKSEKETRHLLRYEFLDTLIAIAVGMAINAAMVIVAASVFFRNHITVTDITQASQTLKPIAGNMASILFGVALLFAGFSSSMTAGIAGGTTFSGYLGKETVLESKWFKTGMLITICPACLIILFISNAYQALIISQVCLSIQLPLTMLPLFLITSNKKIMKQYANGFTENLLMVMSGIFILALNGLLVYNLL
ncbi:Nramp family divalent metal transporter [uncultured Desulfobulbus sp.]|uniref:Nramp family divalent metal transporter n=1 Tax=uncultured Desulfobulbus sp. TaxID=239745 RepID=UPI0029C719F2|nr:Nramp family divalent metal transporter [uncultured Desulfobulbus sp.]